MKKTLVLLLALLAAAASAPAALSKVVDGGFFTIDLPHQPNNRAGAEWQLRPLGENSAVVVPPGRAFSISVSLLYPAPGELPGLAASLAQAHGAREVKRMAGEGEAYEYTGSAEGLPVYAQLFDLADGRAGCIVICGDYENGDAVWRFNSVRFKPAEPVSGGLLPAAAVSGDGAVSNDAAVSDDALPAAVSGDAVPLK